MEIRLDAREWNRLAADLRAFDPALLRALRKHLRAAGEHLRTEVQSAVKRPAPTSGGASVGSRAAIAAGTRVAVSFAARGGKVTLTSANVRGGFGKAYNTAQFRHPVNGNRNAWVSQKGRPYFGVTINKEIDGRVKDEINQALDEAIRSLGGVRG